MRKIEYPKNIRKLKKSYLSIFNISKMQSEWEKLRASNKVLKFRFPKNITRILVAEYRVLVTYYITFQKHIVDSSDFSPSQKLQLKEKLEEIFHYDNGYQSVISAFFMNHGEELNISVCNYCETSFINVYSIDQEKENIDFLNYSSKTELSKKLKIKSHKTLDEIIKSRPISSIETLQLEGINKKWWRKTDKLKSLFPEESKKNHFDLDHVLDKGSCPILALSFKNFVPSCQVCNQRLKRSQVLGDRIRRIPKVHMSPSSRSYDFDEKVKFVLNPLKKDDGSFPNPANAIDNKAYYELDFDVKDQDFYDLIEIFHLKERYEFHKVEGLYWIQLKECYPDANIDLMVSGLNVPEFTKDRIKEDLFRGNYDKIRKPCFQKLKKDCLN